MLKMKVEAIICFGVMYFLWRSRHVQIVLPSFTAWFVYIYVYW